MQKERLFISEDKVVVDFDFLNETDRDVTTEVAFPVPSYGFGYDTSTDNQFADFKVWVDGKQIPYQTDTHAMLRGKDYSDLLRGMGVDAATFGIYDWKKDPPDGSPQISKLSASARAQLIQLGLLDNAADAFPQWSVKKMYYWRQTFPARKLVHIRHEYTPVIGYEGVQLHDFAATFPHACIDANLQKALSSDVKAYLKKTPKGGYGDYFRTSWVDYILTTANTWKTPIKDFELVIEKPESKDGEHEYTSFCWDGPVQRVDQRRFLLHKTNFIPRQELIVYFFLKMAE